MTERLAGLVRGHLPVVLNAVAAVGALLVVAGWHRSGLVVLGVVVLVVAAVLRDDRLVARAVTAGRGPATRAAGASLGAYTVSRALAAVSLALVVDDAGGIVLGALLLLGIVAESFLARLRPAWAPFAANLPGGGLPGVPRAVRLVVPAGHLALLVALVLAAVGAPTWAAAALAALTLVTAAIALLDAIRRRRAAAAWRRSLTRRLTDLAPRFVLYWEAAEDTEYQVAMWLPYLERLGEPFVVVLRHHRNLDVVARLTGRPVVVLPGMADLDDLLVPSLTTAFYVNNAIRNCHFVRFTELTHVQLNHGDSDKAPSFNPVMRMYDVNLVAGRAAVERYAAHGVATREDWFRIVGRPQVADVAPARPREPGTPPTVLYAPTWAGFMADSNYSSLRQGPAIVRALLERGAVVSFRPHPHARRTPAFARACDEITAMLEADRAATGREHAVGPAAEAVTLAECFNASDAMVSDVSSVVPDYLFSGKPFALVAVGATLEAFREENPVAEAAYVVDERLTNLDAALDDLLVDDPLAARREALRTHYLGDIPRETYVDAFVTTARDIVLGRDAAAGAEGSGPGALDA